MGLKNIVRAVNSLLEDWEGAQAKGNKMPPEEWIDGMSQEFEISEEQKHMFLDCVNDIESEE